jgi:hypothetical protein
VFQILAKWVFKYFVSRAFHNLFTHVDASRKLNIKTQVEVAGKAVESQWMRLCHPHMVAFSHTLDSLSCLCFVWLFLNSVSHREGMSQLSEEKMGVTATFCLTTGSSFVPAARRGNVLLIRGALIHLSDIKGKSSTSWSTSSSRMSM